MVSHVAEAVLHVQVCYATPERQWLLALEVMPGTTLHQAIGACGILAEAPEIDLSVWKVGIFGKQKPLDTVLREHDRVEIYRPLTADPMESRRRRAVKRSGK
ncbi:MAG: RnfH family protein [Burkholderiaceae bacterium]|nr:RnfH family protein [Burkholderiaceae bacterium]